MVAEVNFDSHSSCSKPDKPIIKFLCLTGNDHLFDPVIQVDVINTIQKDIDDYWKRYSDKDQ